MYCAISDRGYGIFGRNCISVRDVGEELTIKYQLYARMYEEDVRHRG